MENKNGNKMKTHHRDLSPTNKDGVKKLELFVGDDIFASHED